MTAKIKLNAASGGGSFSLQAPSSSSNNRVFTLPDVADATMATLNGISEFDHWYLPSDWATSASYIDTWTRFTQSNVSAASPLGTGMSHSSGVFTFPTTGKYLVILNAHYLLVQNDNVVTQIQVTTNNSDYYSYATCKDGNSASNTIAAGSTACAFIDVTNTSNVKVQIYATSIASGSNVNGYNSTDGVQTGLVFARIGDT